jgi:hypothetical protein
MAFKGLGIGVNGTAIEAFGVGKAVLGVGDVAGVEEGAGVRGIGRQSEVEFGFGGLPVGFADGGFGFCYLFRNGYRGSGGGSRFG